MATQPFLNSLLFTTQRGEAPLQNFSPPLEKCDGQSLKLLDIV